MCRLNQLTEVSVQNAVSCCCAQLPETSVAGDSFHASDMHSIQNGSLQQAVFPESFCCPFLHQRPDCWASFQRTCASATRQRLKDYQPHRGLHGGNAGKLGMAAIEKRRFQGCTSQSVIIQIPPSDGWRGLAEEGEQRPRQSGPRPPIRLLAQVVRNGKKKGRGAEWLRRRGNEISDI